MGAKVRLTDGSVRTKSQIEVYDQRAVNVGHA